MGVLNIIFCWSIKELKPNGLQSNVFVQLLTTSTTALLNWRTRIDFDVTSSRLSWCWSHTILYFCCHCHKSLLHICGILSACFQEWYSQGVCIFLQGEKYTIALRNDFQQNWQQKENENVLLLCKLCSKIIRGKGQVGSH